MMDSNKKISFAFSKLVKKPAVVKTQPSAEKAVELIDCLEGQSIKIKNAVEVVTAPLVIHIKDNKKNLLDRVKEAKVKQQQSIKRDVKEEDIKTDTELTLDEQAARALINDAKNRLENNTVSVSKITVLPVNEENINFEGEAEPTLEDYENIPISDYGMAMLRGMGWKEGMGIGKNPSKTGSTNTPELRPKGLGLGATRIVKPEIPACDKKGNELILKKGTYAKIIAGTHKGNYCEVQGLDDEAGRVIVRTSLKNEVLTLNEFLLVPVTKEEYLQGAKVLNNAKYEQYKEISDRNLESYGRTEVKIIKKLSDSESDGQVNSRKSDNRSHRDKYSSRRRYSSDNENSEYESENKGKFKSNDTYKCKNYKEKNKYEDDYEKQRNKYKDGESSADSDIDSKYLKSTSKKYRDRSESDDEHRSKNKNKKSKKGRHKERSRSPNRRKKNSKKSSRNRSRSPSYDYYKSSSSSKKHKSKYKHSRRSSSSS